MTLPTYADVMEIDPASIAACPQCGAKVRAFLILQYADDAWACDVCGTRAARRAAREADPDRVKRL